MIIIVICLLLLIIINIMRAEEGAQEGRLATPDRAGHAQELAGHDVQVLQRLAFAKRATMLKLYLIHLLDDVTYSHRFSHDITNSHEFPMLSQIITNSPTREPRGPLSAPAPARHRRRSAGSARPRAALSAAWRLDAVLGYNAKSIEHRA